MKKYLGSISVSTLLWVAGSVALSITWIVQYVNMAVAPVASEAHANDTAISSLTTKVDDIDGKTSKLYDYFIGRGLQKTDPKVSTSTNGN